MPLSGKHYMTDTLMQAGKFSCTIGKNECYEVRQILSINIDIKENNKHPVPVGNYE